MISLLLLLQAAAAPAFGVEFVAPPTWVPLEAPPLRAYAPPRPGRGELLILTVWPAERLARGEDFSTWFQRKLSAPGERVLQQSPLDRRPANGVDALTVTQRVAHPERGQVVRVVYAIADGERVALAMLTSNQDQLITGHAAEARAFFESLRFTPAVPPAAPAPPLPVPPPAGGGRAAIPPAGFHGAEPRGLFYRLRVGSGASGMETETRIFLPSRRILRVYPVGGGESIDPGRCNPDMCGSYRLEGPWLTIRWDTGTTEKLSLARSGEGFTLDGDIFQPARGLDLAEAAGEWVSPGATANPFTTGLRLGRDGSFEWLGGSAATTLRGRYQLEGLTLLLRFADGSSRAYTLFAAGRSRPAGLISFDGTVYARRSR